MKLRIYSTTEPFVNEKGDEKQGYYVAICYKNKNTKKLEVRNMCLFSEPGLNIGDFVEVAKNQYGNYFISKQN